MQALLARAESPWRLQGPVAILLVHAYSMYVYFYLFTRAGLARLEPHLVREKVEPRGVVVLGTVRGDLHDIGKNLVGMMLRGAGYRVVDLGADVPPERFVEAARSERADVVGLSALLTTTMVHMKGVIDALRAAGLGTPVVVGGAPLTREYADGIGARGYAPDAASAVTLVNGLL